MPSRTDSIDITAGHASLVMVLRRSLLIVVLLSLPVATAGCRHSAAAAVPGDNGHEPPVADAQGGPLPTYPVTLSGDGTYLVDRDARPFLLNGEAAWSLIAQLSREDADFYLENRRRKGYDAVVVNLIEHKFAGRAPANFYGDRPFATSGGFDTPNARYFDHADWVIRDAASKGHLVLLAPLYLGYLCGDEGWCAEVRRSSVATMSAWGRYVGARYRNFPNIVWVIGGDTDPVRDGVAEKVRAFVDGLKEADPAHLVTAHNAPTEAAVDPWSDEPSTGSSRATSRNDTWVDLNNVYDVANSPYVSASAQYGRQPFKPFFLIESAYEHEHKSTPGSLRAQAYWTILSGGLLGHIFGNCPIWAFGAAAGLCSSNQSWQAELESAGSTTLALVGKLFASRPFYRLVPDRQHRVLVEGYESGRTYATAARTKDGSTIIVFIPSQRTVRIDLTTLSGSQADAWWYNTRTGASTPIGRFPTGSARAFTAPDQNDWVLVLDDASLSLPPPGS